MKKNRAAVFILPFLFFSCASSKVPSVNESLQKDIPTVEFTEVWGYVFDGCESNYQTTMPVTDIGYFAKAITKFSEVPYVPPKEKYFSSTTAKVHLVTSCDSRSQTHLLLEPSLPLRNKIIDGLIKASPTYDGLQVDWEHVLPEDKKNFEDFLKTLKSKLNGKMLSVAIPARVKTLEKDAYCYADLAKIADRIIIMAYDQHWSTSEPGPVAGTDWCEKIALYAKSQIPDEKLVMGLSFYARAWRDDKTGGKAYTYPTLQKVMGENKIKNHKRDDFSIPSFEIEKKLKITVWYDDAASLLVRTKMYADSGIDKISFWRIGQEDKNYWQHLKIKTAAE